MHGLSMSDASLRRFWVKVQTPDANGCMHWQSALDHHGYGAFRLNGRVWKAHRISLELAVGEPPFDGAEAAHGCRTKNCVAPAHLRWATTAENERDKVRDGTDNRGERQGASKLTETQVIEIRSIYAAGGISQRDLALRYNVAPSNISAIVARRSWRHLNQVA